MTTESWENAADPCLLSGREHTHEQVKDDEIRDEEAISDRVNFRRDMRTTIAEKSPFATSIVTSTAVNIQKEFSSPLAAPISSRMGRMT
jgi:hypothetical protein